MTVTKIGKRLDFWGWETRAAAVRERLGYKGKHKLVVRDVPWLRLGRSRPNQPRLRVCPGCGCEGPYGLCHCDHDIYGPDCRPR